MSADGFVAGPNGTLDWMTWNWDDKLKSFVNEMHANVDTILLGRKMTEGFVGHWESVKPGNPEYDFARIMVDTPKVIFTKTLDKPVGKNTTLAKGNLTEEIAYLKRQNGKDIIVYGGATFVSNLIKENLIDELNLFINPTTLGEGLSIFTKRTNLKLLKSLVFDCGIVVNTYQPS